MIGRVKKKKPVKIAARATTRDEYDDDYGDTYTAEPSMRFTQALIVVIVLHVIAVGGFFTFNKVKTSQEKRKQAEAAEMAKASAAAQKEDIIPAPPPVPELRTHTVVSGENLGMIARKYGTTVAALERLNDIKADSIISIGQELKLPSPKETSTPTPVTTTSNNTVPKPATPPQTNVSALPVKPAVPASTSAQRIAASPPEATPAAQVVASGGTYVVAQGDNPWKIAQKLNVDYNDLIKLNDIQDPTKIQIGQKLKIPPKR